jgi:hypothetical protein
MMIGRYMISPRGRHRLVGVLVLLAMVAYGLFSLNCSILVLEIANKSGHPANLVVFRTSLSGEERSDTKPVWKGIIVKESSRVNLPYSRESAFEFRIEMTDGRTATEKYSYVTLHSLPYVSMSLDASGNTSLDIGSRQVSSICSQDRGREYCQLILFLAAILSCPIEWFESYFPPQGAVGSGGEAGRVPYT